MQNTMSKSNLADIAKALREARAAKRLSQRALSARSGTTQAQISRIENGEVDLQVSSLIELARALGLEVVLTPRSALPAVEAVVRESERVSRRDLSLYIHELENRLKAPVETVSEAQLIAERIRRIAVPTNVQMGTELFRIAGKLEQNFRARGFISPTDLSEIKSYLQAARDEFASVSESSRPAYTLDDEDPDEEEA